MYSSRTRYNTDTFRRLHALRVKLADALSRIPADQRTTEDEATLERLAQMGAINIVHLIYQPKNYEGHAKDYEFSGTSMREHWQSGYEDTKRTLRHPDWMVTPKGTSGLVIHDVHHAE